MPKEPKTIATECLLSWTNGDLDATRTLVADDVSFIGPLGTATGADAYIDGLRQLSEVVSTAVTRKVLVDGNDVCIIYDLVTKRAGTIPTVGWYHVRNGQVDSVRAFFDARALTT
ncbi:MAG: nuclear transport factor 2 family protein [Actinobacteria bacterium]|nr:nuclear transport factor 2 family protein [Actinomycetota bacterium]